MYNYIIFCAPMQNHVTVNYDALKYPVLSPVSTFPYFPVSLCFSMF